MSNNAANNLCKVVKEKNYNFDEVMNFFVNTIGGDECALVFNRIFNFCSLQMIDLYEKDLQDEVPVGLKSSMEYFSLFLEALGEVENGKKPELCLVSAAEKSAE